MAIDMNQCWKHTQYRLGICKMEEIRSWCDIQFNVDACLLLMTISYKVKLSLAFPNIVTGT